MTSLRRVAATFKTTSVGCRAAAKFPPTPWTLHSRASLSTTAPHQGPKAKAPAAPVVQKATTCLDKQNYQVETDPEILAKYCCINYHADKTEGGPGPELREDDYYPDWLWDLEKKKVPYYEMDKKTPEYWRASQRAHQEFQNKLRKAQPFGVV